jgi:hypothetical protein
MGAYTDYIREKTIEYAVESPVIAAPPGYFLLDEKHLDEEPLPVIAWRVGYHWILPITTLGDSFVTEEKYVDKSEHYTLGPDGKVRRHFEVWGSYIPTTWPSLEAWKDWVNENLPKYGTKSVDSPF